MEKVGEIGCSARTFFSTTTKLLSIQGDATTTKQTKRVDEEKKSMFGPSRLAKFAK